MVRLYGLFILLVIWLGDMVCWLNLFGLVLYDLTAYLIDYSVFGLIRKFAMAV